MGHTKKRGHVNHRPQLDRRDSIRNELLGMAVQYHVHIRVSFEDLVVDASLQRGNGSAGVNRFCVRYAILADVLKPGHCRRSQLMHHKEGFRVVGVPHGEMAEGVEDAMVVENVQGINVSGEQLGVVCRSHYLVCDQQLTE